MESHTKCVLARIHAKFWVQYTGNIPVECVVQLYNYKVHYIRAVPEIILSGGGVGGKIFKDPPPTGHTKFYLPSTLRTFIFH